MHKEPYNDNLRIFFCRIAIVAFTVATISVGDPHHFDPDPDPTFHPDADPDPDPDPSFQIKAQTFENVPK
jgi:hypothetical protein